MLIDTQARDLERAASEHAADWRKAQGRTLLNRDTVRALLETAFIAGACHVRRLAVVELDETLAAANATREPAHMHQNCKTCRCPDPFAGGRTSG